MPIYEYRCKKCDKIFEEWTRHIDDNTTQPCPDCGEQAERIVSNTSFVLKGGGWYVTDYGYRKGVKDESSSGGASHHSSGGASGGASGGTSGASSGESSPSTTTAKDAAPAASKPVESKPAASSAV